MCSNANLLGHSRGSLSAAQNRSTKPFLRRRLCTLGECPWFRPEIWGLSRNYSRSAIVTAVAMAPRATTTTFQKLTRGWGRLSHIQQSVSLKWIKDYIAYCYVIILLHHYYILWHIATEPLLHSITHYTKHFEQLLPIFTSFLRHHCTLLRLMFSVITCYCETIITYYYIFLSLTIITSLLRIITYPYFSLLQIYNYYILLYDYYVMITNGKIV